MTSCNLLLNKGVFRQITVDGLREKPCAMKQYSSYQDWTLATLKIWEQLTTMLWVQDIYTQFSSSIQLIWWSTIRLYAKCFQHYFSNDMHIFTLWVFHAARRKLWDIFTVSLANWYQLYVHTNYNTYLMQLWQSLISINIISSTKGINPTTRGMSKLLTQRRSELLAKEMQNGTHLSEASVEWL